MASLDDLGKEKGRQKERHLDTDYSMKAQMIATTNSSHDFHGVPLKLY